MSARYAIVFLIFLVFLLSSWISTPMAQDFSRMPRPEYENKNTLRAPKNPLYPHSHEKADNLEPKTSAGSFVSSLPVRFYQAFISPIDGDKCTHYPPCSAYSLLAIKKHGGMTGFVLTFDRLLHESNEARFSPLVKIGSVIRVFDPVENNTFWWKDSENKNEEE